MLKGKKLLITGGTGSFGNAVLKRFLDTEVEEIRIFSRDEKKQVDMRRVYQNDKIQYYIGDVRDLNSIRQAMYDIDYVFHAAALKQVPNCEFFPLEAVKTNVLGTDNVLTAAIDSGVKKVICLSTDKAAYPVNAMGASKALMEKVFIARARTVSPDRTLICGTRYGNVMCSRGSVIPVNIHVSAAERSSPPAAFFFSGFAVRYIASAAPGSPKIMKMNSPEKYLVASALKCVILAESASCAKKIF